MLQHHTEVSGNDKFKLEYSKTYAGDYRFRKTNKKQKKPSHTNIYPQRSVLFFHHFQIMVRAWFMLIYRNSSPATVMIPLSAMFAPRGGRDVVKAA